MANLTTKFPNPRWVFITPFFLYPLRVFPSPSLLPLPTPFTSPPLPLPFASPLCLLPFSPRFYLPLSLLLSPSLRCSPSSVLSSSLPPQLSPPLSLLWPIFLLFSFPPSSPSSPLLPFSLSPLFSPVIPFSSSVRSVPRSYLLVHLTYMFCMLLPDDFDSCSISFSFAIEMVMFSTSNKPQDTNATFVETTQSLDDEYSPGVFSVLLLCIKFYIAAYIWIVSTGFYVIFWGHCPWCWYTGYKLTLHYIVTDEELAGRFREG